MALSYTIDFKKIDSGNPIVSNALSVVTGQMITVTVMFADNDDSATFSITNNGTAISWGTPILETVTTSNCKVALWVGFAGATPPTTVTVTGLTGNNVSNAKGLCTRVWLGQHLTVPIPVGNRILIAGGGTNVTQALTPTSVGSVLLMELGDWSAIDPATVGMAAGTNCTLDAADVFSTGNFTGAVIRPTVSPRTNTSTFTLAESDTGSKVIGIAYEVQADPGGGGGGNTVLTGFGQRLQGFIYS